MTDSFQVDVSGMQKAFDEFKAISGVKRILSFGGWSFSTDYDTFPIFRQGVTPAQRQTFANNVASFIVDQGLDGVDFDWEYPGAPDIPGVPPGSAEDGPNYLAFLKLVRAALPADMSIGIAAPASYWYLKGFPISDIASVVDYIVYMTYDLHGQWDYGNSFST
jgi:chitinase